MAKQRVDMRLDPETIEWLDAYAKKRRTTRTGLLEAAITSFKEDCQRGVPELKRIAKEQTYVRDHADELDQGVGQCEKRLPGLGHVWKSHKVDEFRSCTFCGMHGRAPWDPSKPAEEQDGYFNRATRERAELFARLHQPQSVRGTTAKEAKG